MKYETIQRGRLTYYITDTAVVVSVGGQQYVSYNIYNSPSRSNLAEFKKKIKSSKEGQLATVIDQMDLASQCKVIGTGIAKPSWIEA